MKNRWIWFGALSAVAVILFAIFNFGGGTKDTLNTEGIRDDVAEDIARTFPNSETLRAAATQLARSLQLAIDKPENALEIEKQDDAATACYYAIRGQVLEDEESSVPLKVEGMVVNSYARSEAYIRYNGKLSGRIFQSIHPDISRCDFDANAMRN